MDANAPRYIAFDLSQMTSLKVLTLYMSISDDGPSDEWDPLLCFNNLLRSASSTCRLEEITVIMELYKKRFNETSHIRYWDDISEVLLDRIRYPCLMKLSIRATDQDYHAGPRAYIDRLHDYLLNGQMEPSHDGPPSFLTLLNASEGMERLRARPGIEVTTTVTDRKWVKSVAIPHI
jgi:hypothetical protein